MIRVGILILCLGLTEAAGAQDVVFRPVYQEPLHPRWYDLARVSGAAASWGARDLPVLDRGPGFLTFGYLREKLGLPGTVTATGAGTIYIPYQGSGPEEKDLLIQLVTFLRDQRDNEEGAFVLEGLDLPGTLRLPVEFRIVGGVKKNGLYAGRVQVGWREPGGSWKSSQILTLRVRPFLALARLRQDVGAGQHLDPSFLTWSQTDLTTVEGRPLLDARGDQGWIAVRDLRSGDFLREDNVKPWFPVNKGDPVTLKVTKGTLAVEMAAQALDEGRNGQSVRVRVATGRRLSAVVLAPGLVGTELP